MIGSWVSSDGNFHVPFVSSTGNPPATNSNTSSYVIHNGAGNVLDEVVIVKHNSSISNSSSNEFLNGFLNPENSSDMQSVSSWMGYAGLHISKYENLFKYTAQTSSGWANKAFALKAAKGSKILGKSLGVAGSILTVAEGFSDGNFTAGDGVKVAIGLLTTFTPYGWAYGLIDLGVGLATGTNLTDRIGAGIDAMNNN